MTAAITREKQLKAGLRARKLALIEAGNPTWRDLYQTLLKARKATLGRRPWIATPPSGGSP